MSPFVKRLMKEENLEEKVAKSLWNESKIRVATQLRKSIDDLSSSDLLTVLEFAKDILTIRKEGLNAEFFLKSPFPTDLYLEVLTSGSFSGVLDKHIVPPSEDKKVTDETEEEEEEKPKKKKDAKPFKMKTKTIKDVSKNESEVDLSNYNAKGEFKMRTKHDKKIAPRDSRFEGVDLQQNYSFSEENSNEPHQGNVKRGQMKTDSGVDLSVFNR